MTANTHASSMKSIFAAAIKLEDESARRAFVEASCRGNDSLRSELQAMLDADQFATTSPLDDVGAQIQFPTSLMIETGLFPAADAPASARIGSSIGPFKLRELIGEGGMGSVYVAEQEQPIRRKVALKVIKPGMDTKEIIARFEAERQALALMSHPNISKVLDGGATDQGRPYFVMDLVRGWPITEYCDQQQLTIRERLQLFLPVCLAVQHAHMKGIIHRDLKPSNVMVEIHDVHPVPKVIDFGVAKAIGQRLSEHSLYTQLSQLVGTPMYMSPEQAKQSSLDIDTRSDVYSLGVLLYELVTGTTPFDKERFRDVDVADLRRIICEEEPPRPSARVSTLRNAQLTTISSTRKTEGRQLSLSLKRELDWIVMKALEKDRSRRYESVSDLADDIQRYLDDEPVEACPPSTMYRLQKTVRRHKGRVATAALLAVTILLALGFLWSERNQTLAALTRESREREKAEEQEQIAERQAYRAKAQESLARNHEQQARASEAEVVRQRDRALHNQYHAEIMSGQADWERGNIGNLHGKLVGHLPVQNEEDRRGWEWYYLFALCHPEEHTLFRRTMRPVASWSPDGEYVAIADAIWNARSGECVRTFSASNIMRYQVAWSPDGQKFAWGMAADDNGIYIWDRATDTVSSLRGHESSVWCVAWSPDGTQLASGSLDGTVRIWNVAQGTTVHTLPAGNYVTDVGWSPDGELLAASVKFHDIKIWRPATSELIAQKSLVEGQGPYATRLSWHPSGQQLAVSTPAKWSLLKRSDWSVIREQDHRALDGRDIAWNPDGTRLAVAHGEVVTIWDPAGEQPLATLRGHLRPVNSVAWSPDGAHLVTSDQVEEVKIWDWDAPLQPPQMSTGGHLESLAWLTDGQTLATVDAADRSASSWDATQGIRLRIEQPQVEGPVNWSPDRRLLAVRAGTDENPEIRILDAASGAVHSLWQGAEHRLHKVVWSPDSAKLAIATTFEGSLYIDFQDVDREQTISRWEKQQLTNSAGRTSLGLGQLKWSDECTRVAVSEHGDVGDDGSVAWKQHAHIVDVATGKRILKHKLGARRHRGSVTALAWSPDGDLFACGGSEGMVEVLDVHSGHVLASMKPHNARIDALAWSPDGLRLASASSDATVKVLGASDAAELLTFPFDEDTPEHLAWSGDGHRLAAASQSGIIHVWDAERGYQFREDGSRRGELAWLYYQRVRAARGEGDRPALREFLRLAPDTLGYWEARGHAQALLCDYQRAAQEFAKEIRPDMQFSFQPARYQAFALLGAGDLARYREACGSLVESFGESVVPSNRRRVAWLCALSPTSPADSGTLVEMARSLRDYDSRDDNRDFRVLLIGTSQLRNGQLEDAVDTLTALASKLDRGGDTTDRYQLTCAQYFIALARHQQGHQFQARRHLEEARQNADAYRQTGSNWTALVALDALQRETEAVSYEP